ncbi:MAG: acyl-CoA thioesterase [Pseudomonadota bacterium]|jgi:acyl-CoA thioester hydrolase|nr:acyl-CoA thioesterase [Pseudomonadota bacterium]
MPQLSSPRPLEAYPSRTRADIRYADLDRQGHVNNAVFATFSEIGRVAFLYDPEHALAAEGASFVIARIEIDFHAELRWPGSVEIGTGITEIGRSSFRIAQGIFSSDGLAASVASVLVMTDERTRRSMPLPPATRSGLEALMLR